MEIRTLESESSLILAIKGILDTSHSRDLENFIDTKMLKGYRKFLLDCSQLDSISSGGISFLIRLQEKMKATPGLICVLAELNSEISKILRFFGIEKKIASFRKQSEAKLYLSKIPSQPINKNPSYSRSVDPNTNGEHPVIREESKIRDEFRSASPTATVSRSPYKDRIRFYYKGSTPLQSSRKSFSEPVSRLEPVSKLEPVLEEKEVVENKKEPLSPIKDSIREKPEPILAEEILSKLEHKMDEIKKEVSQSREGLVELIRSDIDSKFSKWEQKQSPVKSSITHSNSRPEEIILCESCGTRLKVRNTGKYKCPSCRSEFLYRGVDSISFLEKLA
jgi:anti-anti-sigma factor